MRRLLLLRSLRSAPCMEAPAWHAWKPAGPYATRDMLVVLTALAPPSPAPPARRCPSAFTTACLLQRPSSASRCEHCDPSACKGAASSGWALAQVVGSVGGQGASRAPEGIHRRGGQPGTTSTHVSSVHPNLCRSADCRVHGADSAAGRGRHHGAAHRPGRGAQGGWDTGQLVFRGVSGVGGCHRLVLRACQNGPAAQSAGPALLVVCML